MRVRVLIGVLIVAAIVLLRIAADTCAGHDARRADAP